MSIRQLTKRNIAKAITQSRDLIILLVLFETGCKVKELLELKAQSISTNKIIFKSWDATISENLQRELKSYSTENNMKFDDYLFSTRQSSQMTQRRIEQIIKSASSKIGTQFSARDIRKRRIANDKKKGISIPNRQKKTKTRIIPQGKNLKEINKLPLFNQRDKIIFGLIRKSACKISDLLCIKCKDVSQNSIKISGQKIRFRSSFIKTIKQATRGFYEEDYIFKTRQSENISPRRIQQIFRNYEKKYHLENFTPQSYRNLLVQNGSGVLFK